MACNSSRSKNEPVTPSAGDLRVLTMQTIPAQPVAGDAFAINLTVANVSSATSSTYELWTHYELPGDSTWIEGASARVKCRGQYSSETVTIPAGNDWVISNPGNYNFYTNLMLPDGSILKHDWLIVCIPRK